MRGKLRLKLVVLFVSMNLTNMILSRGFELHASFYPFYTKKELIMLYLSSLHFGFGVMDLGPKGRTSDLEYVLLTNSPRPFTNS